MGIRRSLAARFRDPLNILRATLILAALVIVFVFVQIARYERPVSQSVKEAPEASLDAAVLTPTAAHVTTAAGTESTLRVCADPNDLPFSNQRRQGFENKIAALVGRSLREPVKYVWWSERKNFVRNTLGAGLCDVVMGLPSGMPGVLTTRPYYRSAYSFVYRKDRELNLRSLNDPRLRRLRIGVHVTGDDYAPPARALARRGIVNNIVGYSLFGAYSEQNPSSKIIDAVASGKIDVAIVWGPLAGYFAGRERVTLAVVPISTMAAPNVPPLAYSISVGVRKSAPRLEAQVQAALLERHTRIHQILTSYGVPLTP